MSRLIVKNILENNYPTIMGILNVTPDSFYDGGKYSHLDNALAQAENMLTEGAHIIDVGGESTRPYAKDVSLQEELDRVIPVIEKISQNLDAVISIDTSKAAVMDAAIKAGAHIINDVRALQEEGALDVAVDHQVPVCIMHMQGAPRTMQKNPYYEDVVWEVNQFLVERAAECIKVGIDKNNIIIDPGFGFGKNLEHNLTLLKNLGALADSGYPVLAGISNKSMFKHLLDLDEDKRIYPTISAHVIAYLNGASIIRVHNVRAAFESLALAKAVKEI